MKFKTIDEYRAWLSESERIMPFHYKLNSINNKYSVSSFGYIFDGFSQVKNIYRSSNGNDYILLTLEDYTTRYFQLDKLIAFVFYCNNFTITDLNQIIVEHIDGDMHNHKASNLQVKLNKELWKKITYPGIKRDTYLISNYGRMKRILDDYIYKPITDQRYGYMFYSVIQSNGQYLHRFIHRLVAWEFLSDTRLMEYDVNHINGIKSDNFPDNLEWVNRKDNINHALYTGLNDMIGENSPNAKMTNLDAEEICKLLVEHNGDIQVVFNDLHSKNKTVSRWVIEQIKYKKKWKHISDIYFQKHQFDYVKKHRSGFPILDENNVHLIARTLVKNNMNIYQTFDELCDTITGLTQSQIYKIKAKSTWKKISDQYF